MMSCKFSYKKNSEVPCYFDWIKIVSPAHYTLPCYSDVIYNFEDKLNLDTEFDILELRIFFYLIEII